MVWKTTNGGTSWVGLPKPGDYYLYSIRFPVNTQTGFLAGGGGRIYATPDGGASWQQQTISPPNYRTLWSVWFPTDNQTGYAVGDYGTILKTTNGGPSWVEERTEGSRQLAESRIRILPNPFISFATVQGHEAEHFDLYDISGRKVGTYRGDRIGEGLVPGVYFLRPEGGSARPIRIVKVR